MNLSRRELEFTRDDRLPARFGEPREPGREDRLAAIPNLGGTISDNGQLCQPDLGFQADLDIAFGGEVARILKSTGCRRGQK